jgi:hypothetical protein
MRKPLGVPFITRIFGSLILGVKGSREVFFGSARGDIRGLRLGIERTSVYRQCMACRNIRDRDVRGRDIKKASNLKKNLKRKQVKLTSKAPKNGLLFFNCFNKTYLTQVLVNQAHCLVLVVCYGHFLLRGNYN